MKRLITPAIIIVILTCTAVFCLAQYKPPLETVQLSEPRLTGPMSLEQTLAERRSIRNYSSRPLDLTQISQLAWAAQGITEKQKGFRTAPSAGAVYPIELYFATQDGLFVYQPAKHCLGKISVRDLRSRLASASMGQSWVAQAGCDIIIAGSVQKLAVRYGGRAEKFMLLEAGHIAQNIHLQAVSLGLASVPIGAFDISQVHSICNLPITLEPLYIICVGYPETYTVQEKPQMPDKQVKKAVLIIAGSNFRDEELFETKRALESAKVQTVIASTRTGTITGMLGGRAQADILIGSVLVDDYDAIVFVGGSGAAQYFDDSTALNIARSAAGKSKLLAAICIAPTILANAGVLDGVTATSFPSEQSKLERAGALYTGAPLERDGLIITADGPSSAARFGKTIADALADK
jgi:SagB-type dehydrogenase family enzyme